MINPYQSDLKSLPTEEIKRLSAELEESYRYTDADGCDDWYLGEDAEYARVRHGEMQAEVYRRWAESNPEEAQLREQQRRLYAATPGLMTREALRVLNENLAIARTINREYEREFTKVGQSVSVRRPERFIVHGG